MVLARPFEEPYKAIYLPISSPYSCRIIALLHVEYACESD